jgi:hypothetical protein
LLKHAIKMALKRENQGLKDWCEARNPTHALSQTIGRGVKSSKVGAFNSQGVVR